jgi:UPF0755 protein
MANERKEKRARRRRGGFVDILNGLLTLLVLGIIAVAGIMLYGANSFYAPGAVKADTNFVVEKGSRLGTIAERLEEQGLIDNKYIFQVGTWAMKKQSEIKAGEFVLKANFSMADVLKEITEGKPLVFAVIVPEGFTSWQVIDRLAQNPDLTGELTKPAEGTILPGSYDYDRGMPRGDVLAAMQTAMAEKVTEIFAGCDPAVCGPEGVVKSAAELVTLASIVEKETGVATERPQVAAVFVNRLKKGMRLQSDPTIIYAITAGEGRLDRAIKKSEIEAKNDYNTYQMDGLPVGPIANPGVESLEAVAHPAATKDLYFVARTTSPSDGHLFAATYAEHRKNVAAYRKATAEADTEGAREALEAEQAKVGGETVEEPAAPATPQ